MKWATLDSTYIQHELEDGANRMFYIKKSDATEAIFIYGEQGPAELLAIANWLDAFRQEHEFKVANNKIDFGDLRRIVIVRPVMPGKSK